MKRWHLRTLGKAKTPKRKPRSGSLRDDAQVARPLFTQVYAGGAFRPEPITKPIPPRKLRRRVPVLIAPCSNSTVATAEPEIEWRWVRGR